MLRKLTGYAMTTLMTGAALLTTTAAHADPNDVTVWNFDVTSTGQDVHWTSPTAVCNQTRKYDASFLIFLIEIDVEFLSITFGPFDVTDQVPLAQRSGGGIFDGPPPFEIFNNVVRFPDPPAAPTVAATVRIALDPNGVGEMSATNITLGTIVINLGIPFGTQEVQITQVRLLGQFLVEPLIVGDFDSDRDVDLGDLAVLLLHFGLPQGATLADGDADGDGDVDLGDLAVVLLFFGANCGVP